MSVRMIRAKFAGRCSCCGRRVARGESVAWNMAARTVAHAGCHAKRAGVDAVANDYAGDGLDARWEDDCARACGLL